LTVPRSPATIATMTDSIKKERLPAREFCDLGRSLYGDRGWQGKLAGELKTDLATVKKWSKEGPPADVGEKLTRIAIEHRTQILYALIAPDMPEDDLTYSRSWERATWIIRDYGILLPYATMNDPDDRNMVVRIAADLLRYCAHKKISFETVMREAEALYKFNPLDLASYVLSEDPQKIAELQKQFDMTQDQAVDMIIEFTEYGDNQGLRQFYGRKGTPSERIQNLRGALRESEENSARFLSWYDQLAKAKAVDKGRRPRTGKKQQ
jgi:hypothetical protein